MMIPKSMSDISDNDAAFRTQAEAKAVRCEPMTDAELPSLICDLLAEVEKWRKMDAEAATHVESVLCLRTHFTGNPPYVGWKGLGLALRESLDERDRLREENSKLRALNATLIAAFPENADD